jgi:hypothetical protein
LGNINVQLNDKKKETFREAKNQKKRPLNGRLKRSVKEIEMLIRSESVAAWQNLFREDEIFVRLVSRCHPGTQTFIQQNVLGVEGLKFGVLTTYSGVRFPGYLSTSENIKFSDLPGGAISSWAALPTAAWFQIVIFISFCEINFLKQDPNKEAGNVVPEGIPWARYPDGYDVWLGDGSTKQVGKDELILGRTWKLNAERNNGRAAMMGMTGLIIHEALTGNPFFPIGEQL